MGGRWIDYGMQLACFVFLFVVFEIHGCWSLNSEGLALLQFRAKVDSDPFEALANWNPNDCDPCTWSGIDCVDGKVHRIDLNGQELEGVLAPEFGNLTHLRYLHLSKNHFFGTIPPQFGLLGKLEVLDLTNNNLTGTIPAELGELHSLKLLLLCNNSFEGSFPVEIGRLSLLTDLQFDETLTITADGVYCANRKFGHCIWQNVLTQSKKLDSYRRPIKGTIIHYLNLFPLFKSGSESSHDHADNSYTNFTDSSKQGVIQDVNYQVNNVRRVLAEQSSNLAADPPNAGPPSTTENIIALPSRSSGSFPAVPNTKILSPAPVPSPNPAHSPGVVTETTDKRSSADAKSGNQLKLVIGILVAAFLLIIVAVVFLIFRRRASKTGPWKSGLSGQLQKAFVTGVPKLNRAELETACEDFSNIIDTCDGVVTVYKGTLSNGVEIIVVSTVIDSLKDWSKHSELAYRNKIDSLSRVNHKNYVNLIGFCEEEEPFTRMMVFEYAPNGTLFEHLHVKEAEHLDWNARMRIIMGTAYCLQYMHDLNPPVVHYDLNSKEILLTDDYAAKIADIGFWAELLALSKQTTENEFEHSELPYFRINSELASVETNILSFGVLMLELISGKQTYSEKQGHLTNWAAQYLNDKRNFSYLKDPILESFENNELEVVCEVILWCITRDPQKRPTMNEVIQKLRQAIDISPDAATPRLSPLWWAELEVLSAEAA